MNKFDERYEIRLASKGDIELIMNFIDTYWAKGHIMARDRGLFEYEYAQGDQVNFILAIDKNTKLLEAIFGFLPCSNTTDKSKMDIWGSMWKVNETHENLPFLGVELAKRVYDLTGCRSHIGNGANPRTTVPLRKIFFRDKTVKMNQYYRLNKDIKEYQVAVIQDASVLNYKIRNSGEGEIELVPFHSIEELIQEFNVEKVEVIPYKDYWYLEKRYFKHPYYSYQVYGLKESGVVKALLMMRAVECSNNKILRIVDYIGEHRLFGSIGHELDNMIRDGNYEYIDFYQYGMDEKYILEAGFRLRMDEDVNIIPNYFEPFLQKNIDIWAHYKEEGTTFFKADCDQDRPNQLRKFTPKNSSI